MAVLTAAASPSDPEPVIATSAEIRHYGRTLYLDGQPFPFATYGGFELENGLDQVNVVVVRLAVHGPVTVNPDPEAAARQSRQAAVDAAELRLADAQLQHQRAVIEHARAVSDAQLDLANLKRERGDAA